MKTKRQFILDTLLPYKQDPTTCASEDGGCLYLTDDGKKCAVGKHMKEGHWQTSTSSIGVILEDTGLELKDILTKEAIEQGLTLSEWKAIQQYHDGIALEEERFSLNKYVDHLERVTGYEFPELFFF